MTAAEQHNISHEVAHLQAAFNAAKVAFIIISVNQDQKGEIFSNMASGKMAKAVLEDAASNIPDDISELVVEHVFDEDLEDDVYIPDTVESGSELPPC